MKVLSTGTLLLAVGCTSSTPTPPPCDRSVVGNVCTIAGSSENGYSGEDGPALAADLSLPMDTLVATDGSLYILDWNNHRVRNLTSDGKIHFVMGNGELGGSVDDPATGYFNHPTGLIYSPSGDLQMAAWHNSKILTLAPAANTTESACGDGKRAYNGDEGPAKMASLNLPSSIAYDSQGNLTIMDQANQVIRKVDPAGNIHRFAGNCVVDSPAPSGPGACAGGVAPSACPAPSNVTVCGDPALFCGTACTPGYAGDEGPASGLRMAQQFGQAADPGGRLLYDKAGNLYFADVSNDLIRMIDTAGIVHRIAGQPPVAKVAQAGYGGDGGPAINATLNHPVDLALGGDGTIYFSDVYNHCIRAIAPDTNRTIHTVAGVCGTKGDASDGPATSVLFNRPYGVEWQAPNTLYVADTGNSVIRAVNLP